MRHIKFSFCNFLYYYVDVHIPPKTHNTMYKMCVCLRSIRYLCKKKPERKSFPTFFIWSFLVIHPPIYKLFKNVQCDSAINHFFLSAFFFSPRSPLVLVHILTHIKPSDCISGVILYFVSKIYSKLVTISYRPCRNFFLFILIS